jgi:hypothetical protein
VPFPPEASLAPIEEIVEFKQIILSFRNIELFKIPL